MWFSKIDSYDLGDIKVSVHKTKDPEIVLIRSKGPNFKSEFEVPLEEYKKNPSLINRRITNEFKSNYNYHMFG